MTTTIENNPATFEQLKPLFDQLSKEEKIILINKLRADWGFPARTLEEMRDQGAAFTPEELAIVDRLVAAAD